MSGPPAQIPAVEHQVTRAQLAQYADASGDHNPLHLDEEFARSTPYGRPIAHGMLVLAFVSEMMTKPFGSVWVRGGKLRTRFRAPVFPGDAVRASGTLRSSSETTATYDVRVTNQDGADVITGEATVPLGVRGPGAV